MGNRVVIKRVEGKIKLILLFKTIYYHYLSFNLLSIYLFILVFSVVLIDQTRRWCYQCNSSRELDCRKPQNEGPYAKLCPEFENFCTIFLVEDLVIRKCSNVIRCPDDYVRCCSCTENFCNWAENCYEVDEEDHSHQINASPWLIMSSLVVAFYCGYIY